MKRLCAGATVSTLILTASLGLADDLSPVTACPTPKHAPVTLVKDGQPAAVIVSPAKPPPLLRAAIQDLQTHLEKVTGAKLPIVAAPSNGMASLIVAIQPDDQALFPKPVGPEGFAVKTGPDSVSLAGQDEPGAAWAIYDFLERAVGVRWYWPEHQKTNTWTGTYLPHTPTLTVAPAHWTDAPAFRMREIWPSGGPRIGAADLGGLHRRLRSFNSWPVKLIVHAPHGWDSLYKETRPEIFQLRADGQRDFSMLCYGNPATLKTYLDQIERQLASTSAPDRATGILNGKSVTVSPADIPVSCSCKDCQALWNANGGPYGTASHILGTFVSRLAKEVKTRWPDLTVIFLPYKNYTYAPEGIAFTDNVEIQICGMPGLALYKEPAINASEQANIDAWHRLTGRRIQNWHYSCWPEDRTLAAYLFPKTITTHYRANRDKTVGSFINGERNHWQRQHVSLYVWMKTLWNPDFDATEALDAFVKNMYGPAAVAMKIVIGMQIAGWEDSRWPDAGFSPKSIYEISYPRTKVQLMEKMLADAFLAAKDDPLVTRRLEYAAGPLREFFKQSEEHASGAGLKTLNLLQAADDPVIDGKLDDTAWAGTEPLPFVMAQNREKPQPRFPTTVQAVWTRRGVTFGFRMTEPETAKLMKDIGPETRDASLIWWNDNVELFLDVMGNQTDYYQIIVNASGSIADFHGKDASWNGEGLKAAAFVGDGFWSLEVYVPYSAFPAVKGPATGIAWYGNFTRHRVTDKSNREYQRFNTRFATVSNDQNAFGRLPFIER
jgi:hypothetical protein